MMYRSEKHNKWKENIKLLLNSQRPKVVNTTQPSAMCSHINIGCITQTPPNLLSYGQDIEQKQSKNRQIINREDSDGSSNKKTFERLSISTTQIVVFLFGIEQNPSYQKTA
jgi:CRISPR/Cas system CSM-associated protein Csm2 small subunit